MDALPPLPPLQPLPDPPALPPLPGVPPAKVPAATKAPESLGWYIELTKWLIGIDAAVLVFGFDKLHVSELTGWLWKGFWLSAGLLGLSIGAGVLCCMQILAYANRKEEGRPAAGEKPEDVEGYRKKGTIFYKICAGGLWIGIVIFAAVWAVSTIRAATESAPGPVIMALPGKSNAVLVNPRTMHGPSTVLVRDKDGKFAWADIAIPEARVPSSSAPIADITDNAPVGSPPRQASEPLLNPNQ